MSIAGVGAGAAIDYATQSPPVMKGEAVKDAAQVLVARKAMDVQADIARQLIASITGVGRDIDIQA